ncbi:MAG: class I SAM-dependent methyltransferase [Spirochaetia bacterium]|nr:class I SAM-dependent methyltransferase [Spirochaetia bacterium]
MSCRQCTGVKRLFDDKTAKKELKRYRKKGPSKTTRILLDFIIKENAETKTLLDIGGGVGAVQHGLFEAGISKSTDVDASISYLNAAKKLSEEKGSFDQSEFVEGDFTDETIQPEPADIVTLDRVICCYDEMEKLVGKSSSLAGKIYGVVYPRETWYVYAGHYLSKFLMFMICHPFRMYVHPHRDVDRIIQKNGFLRKYHGQSFFWRIDVYVK